jgi:hypothetical protein
VSKACIIIPYYGKWPPFLNLFLTSCSFNPELTILIFSDLEPPVVYPDNVKFISYNFSLIKSSLDEILHYESALTTPYKLCDVRPAYGLIFKDFIKEFDFWGWGDIDLIFGCVKDFGLSELMHKYDVISFKENWVSGSFCLVRNTAYINRLFYSSKDLKLIYTSPAHMCFDEISFCWEEAKRNPIDQIKFPHDNFTRIVTEAARAGHINSFFGNLIKESIPDDDFLIWHNGRLSDNYGKAYLHYHFITEKRRPYFSYPKWTTIPENYYINNRGFFTEGEFKRRKWISIKRMLMAIPKIAMSYLVRIKKSRKLE